MTRASGYRLITSILPLLASAACTGGTGSADPSWLRAEVMADGASASFQGNGYFYVTTEDGRREFGISAAEVPGDGSTFNTFNLYRRGALRPTPGDYAVGLIDYSEPASRGIGVIYGRSVDGIQESFSATSGVVRIRESTRERVTGTFELEVARYCAFGPDIHTPCPMAWNPPADAPTMRVTGEFSVVYDDGEVEPLPWEVPIPGT